MSFWDVVWFIFISFAFVAYLMVLFSILGPVPGPGDIGLGEGRLDRCPHLPAAADLTDLPDCPGLGHGGTVVEERRGGEAAAGRLHPAGRGNTSLVDQIAQARAMLDSGAITQTEYDALKAKALV